MCSLIGIGYHKYSVAYLSTGFRRFNQPFTPTLYGPQYVQGDVIGVGYRPRTGTIFFTRNGKKLEDVVHGLKSPNFFPAIGANGPATINVNFGQAGFVFIEANVKKWGLAPMTGSLAPPPPYGSEQGSILLESGRKDGYTGSMPARGHGHSQSLHTYAGQQHVPEPQHGRSRSGNFRVLPPTSPGPARSPTDISLAHLVPTDEAGEPSGGAAVDEHGDGASRGVGLGLHGVHNPPPPEYTSPEHSDVGSRRASSDSENTPLIRVNRSRGASAATIRPTVSTSHPEDSPPIPSYSDAVRQGAARDRSDSAMSSRRQGP